MQFHFEPREGFLLVRATGPFDARACREVMADIARICTEREIARVTEP